MKLWGRFLLVFILFSVHANVYAQFDSSFIANYQSSLTGRILLNRKYTALNVSNDVGNYSVRYRPNKTVSAGLGMSYKFFTLNISTSILRPSEKKGETRHLDLQLNKYGRRFMTDLLMQFYKGFYIPGGKYAPPNSAYYLRPDLAVSTLGLSSQYIFNHRKFSYRAAFQQTEVQKKSAGSFTIGLELFMGRFKGDSTVIPAKAVSETPETMYRMRFIRLGPNAGYIHTWVYHNFFVTAGGTISLSAGINRFFDQYGQTTFGSVSPNSAIKLATGYNAEKWGINAVFISRDLHLPDFENRSIFFNAGNIRMNFVYRFRPGKDAKNLLRGIDKVDEKLKDK